MSAPDTTETEAQDRVQVEALAMLISQTIAPAWWNGDKPDQYATADGLETYEVPDDQDYDLARAVIAAGWISPTEAATRDAAQRAAGAETEHVEMLEYAEAVMKPLWQAEAWDEGYEAGFSRSFDMLTGYTKDRQPNPYRIGGAS